MQKQQYFLTKSNLNELISFKAKNAEIENLQASKLILPYDSSLNEDLTTIHDSLGTKRGAFSVSQSKQLILTTDQLVGITSTGCNGLRLENIGTGGNLAVYDQSGFWQGDVMTVDNSLIDVQRATVFKTNNIERMRIDNNGIRIGVSGNDIPTLRYGRVVGANAVNTVLVSFGYTFPNIPTVVVTQNRNADNFLFQIQILNVGTSSFTYRYYFHTIAVPSGTYQAGDNHFVNWIAIG